MTEATRRSIADLVLSLLVAGGAVILFIGAADLPPPRFEPLGSAALPRILGALLLLFAAILALRAGLRLHRGWVAPKAEVNGADPRKGFAVLLALILYVLALDVLRVPFVAATTVFVVVVGLSIGARNWRNLLVFAGLGLVLSLAISTILSRFLFITIG
ncbi:tripartite tricarboxylate transporter TctB family protein [Oceaniglobus trochenteri]|uniref:tripartite tricarboxylate transporter TctB family protein n=1 Tax=Oceaniglobus trochenteri TaxID=2763260 RepID=UPI001CFF874C|nr:tripartite tricarboxylate transporter TctB family protein [Oceaniglobus trochenteri]